MNSIIEWIKTNWNEESNVGKAKVAAVAALIFLLIASLVPDSGREPALVSPSTGIDSPAEAGADAARQAAEAYSSYEARVGELERETQAATGQAAEAYRSYESRVGELERETQSGADAAAETYASYEARVAELERAQQALVDQLAAKDRRIAELERGLSGAGGAAGIDNLELRLQLEAMRTTLDQMLRKLEQ